PPGGRKRAGVLRRFFSGAGYLGTGFRAWGTSPGLMLLGMIPAVIVGLVYLAGIVILVLNIDSIIGWATAFADGGEQPWQGLVRVLGGVALVLLSVMVLINTFTALTLAVGEPFYERIWNSTEKRLGGAVEDGRGFWKGLGQGIGTGLRLLLSNAMIAVL